MSEEGVSTRSRSGGSATFKITGCRRRAASRGDRPRATEAADAAQQRAAK